MICKICKQYCSLFDYVFRLGMCTSCKVNIDLILYPIEQPSREWIKHQNVSKRAVEKYLRNSNRK